MPLANPQVPSCTTRTASPTSSLSAAESSWPSRRRSGRCGCVRGGSRRARRPSSCARSRAASASPRAGMREEGGIDLGHVHERTHAGTATASGRAGRRLGGVLQRAGPGLLRLLGQHLPLADGRGRAAPRSGRAGRAGLVEVDSAGTGPWHVGDDMDERSRQTLERGRLRRRARTSRSSSTPPTSPATTSSSPWTAGTTARCGGSPTDTDDPAAARATIVLLREFDPQLRRRRGPRRRRPLLRRRTGFTDVLAQVERSCAALLDAIERAVEAGADRGVGRPIGRTTAAACNP